MATHQNVCFFNKYGYCKFLKKCRKYHEDKNCEKIDCEISECSFRHPIMCKFFQDFGFCKFGEWCKFAHKDHKVTSKNDMEIHELKNKLQTVKKELERNGEKIMQLETNFHEMQIKIKEKEQTISKINKKYNCLREKVTLLFDLEEKVDNLEKKVEKVEKAQIETVDKPALPQVQNSKTNITPGGNEEFKCNVCDFVGKNKFGLKIHYHKKHSTATFNCFTCDFTCESYSDLCEHNEKYYYSHRQVLNKDYEKHILDEFQRLDEDGFLIHRKLDW